jgi:23S rRNA (cytidine1920-2'-O)/16S rRNA (cytidine1409-2'-O)-methyltransferase
MNEEETDLVKEDSGKKRLDVYLVEKGLVESRHQAQQLIEMSRVTVNHKIVTKSNHKTTPADNIVILEGSRYVGRGGFKLEGALKHFNIPIEGKECFDIGASTGGFTDCLLQNGAKSVFAIDAGHSQFHESLKSNPKVEWHEKVNARYLTPDFTAKKFDLMVMDVSFISCTEVLYPVIAFAKPSSELLILIKPQFELTAKDLGRSGIVRNEKKKQVAVEKIRDYVQNSLSYRVKGVLPCPVMGDDGNQEYWLWANR